MNEYSTIIGMDLGDKMSHWALMIPDDDEVQEEGTVRTSKAAMHRKFSALPASLVAIEVGAHSRWVSQLLEELGHTVLVANARKLRMIYANELKNDQLDARTLARVARMDPYLLAPIQHRSEEAQADLAVLKARDALTRARSALISHARGIVKAAGERLPRCSTESFHHKALPIVPEALLPALEPLLQTIHELTARIAQYDKVVEQRCAKYEETQLFREIAGVGPVTSLAFALIIDCPERFRSSRDVAPYLGLIPRRAQSGDCNPQLRITKTGNPYLRRLLVQSAQYILGPLNKQDSALRQWGLKLAGPEDGAGKRNRRLKRRAVIAVARKLACLLHRLWITGEIYEPFPNLEQETKQTHAA